jgi:hypothetical protein
MFLLVDLSKPLQSYANRYVLFTSFYQAMLEAKDRGFDEGSPFGVRTEAPTNKTMISYQHGDIDLGIMNISPSDKGEE